MGREAVYEIVGTPPAPAIIFQMFRDVPLRFSRVEVANKTSFDVVIYAVAGGKGLLEIVRAGQSETSPAKVSGNVSNGNKVSHRSYTSEDCSR